MKITADRFLQGVKRRNTLTENDVLLDDDALLALGDDIIKSNIVPLLVSVRGEFLVAVIEEACVVDQSAYNFPARAAGMTLRDIKLNKGNGDVSNLVQIEAEDEHRYRGQASGTPEGYYFKNDQVIVLPAPSSDDWTFELWHEQAPSALTKLENAAVVESVADDIVTVTSVPDVLIVGAECDFVRGKPGHRVLAMEKAISNVSGADITFATDAVPDGLVAGDYISLAETSPVLQIPDVLHPLLETIVSKRATYALGDFEARHELSEDEKTELKNALVMLEPRNRGEAKKIVNTGGLLRGRRGTKRRGYYG